MLGKAEQIVRYDPGKLAREVAGLQPVLQRQHVGRVIGEQRERIGADLPADHARPLSPGALRRILRQVDAQGHVRATYHVLTVLWRKS